MTRTILPVTNCDEIERSLDSEFLYLGAPLPRRNGAHRSSHLVRRALAVLGGHNPWTDFVLGPSYGRALPPLPEDRRRA